MGAVLRRSIVLYRSNRYDYRWQNKKEKSLKRNCESKRSTIDVIADGGASFNDAENTV
jgi:hypothetical protein